MREPSAWANECSNRVIGAAIAVHRRLGPGFLEATYEEALAIELAAREIAFERRHTVIVRYNGVPIGEHRIDLLADAIFFAQTRAYLAAAELELGLLINFNVRQLREGLHRVVWTI